MPKARPTVSVIAANNRRSQLSSTFSCGALLPSGMTVSTCDSFALGSRRLRRILDLTGFVVRLSSMSRMLALGLIVELSDSHMLEPIPFLAFRTMHRRIAGRWGIDAVKMVKARLPTIGLRFDTKCAFHALTDEQQFCRGIAHGFIEHQELDPPVAFVKPETIANCQF